ncbi:phosphate ABC transporter permease subunit PstC [Turicibacter sanguinis]|uniref:Phosphate transport system permease protein n=2 Tax=Turicibacter sanguinis TaxID=154288 RepID=A0A173TH23_9FIRM|nr:MULTISPECIES: phosphate ABC transporter permease subunit PstC [Turicibacter]EFF64469.1 phosphate ABC transporter, permease protein PstC [Turicibacter sanguinis PC909]KAB6101743.1 phosphate ABC transporter permease subunit PstC [Bacteroides xylanisolvens]EGC91561.1 phosphate ABC transporter, permease protein PstC [Turicibacter sp. HGF1]MBP3903546.1 phosphate ABC transporter permease subunit PstC [Turicibacter sp.]MCU7192222.1 phosphate ABC transporter permease subunit PstC [Turicibacter sang
MKKDMAINRKRVFLERFFHIVFLVAALFAVISVALIIIFIFGKGLAPFFPNNKFGTYNFIDFITGLQWKPKIGDYGIGYMIVSSIVATLGAIVIGVPIALLTSIFIAEVAPKWLANIVRPAVELLAAIPSVLYGVFGFAVITPMVKSISPYPTGDSLLAVIIVLTIMILPTIVAVVETAIRAVPSSYKEGSLALGASKMQTIFKVILPAAKSGILTGVILGVGRAIGETMAVILVAGNPESGIPQTIFDRVRLLTTNIALEQGYAAELHEQMLFSTAVILFIFIMIINLVLSRIQAKAGDR